MFSSEYRKPAVDAFRRVQRPECTALAVLEFDRVGELLANDTGVVDYPMQRRSKVPEA
jgi:hypothetical protein